MSPPFNVGVIGYGMSAKVFHIPLIQTVPEFKLYAVVQRHPAPENDVEKDHPGIKSYRSTEDLVKDDKLDFVVVTTIPNTHVELTKLALENGKHGMLRIPDCGRLAAPTGTQCPSAGLSYLCSQR